jgi:hypothetical protein
VVGTRREDDLWRIKIDETYYPHRLPRRDEKPRFNTRRSGDHLRQMREWAGSKLDDEAVWEELGALWECVPDPWADETAAVQAAEYGFIEPLRRLFPGHVKFINLPPLQGQGKRWPKEDVEASKPDFNNKDFRLHVAIAEARYLRTTVWPEHYDSEQPLKLVARVTRTEGTVFLV